VPIRLPTCKNVQETWYAPDVRSRGCDVNPNFFTCDFTCKDSGLELSDLKYGGQGRS
jgi:hypothetical protein